MVQDEPSAAHTDRRGLPGSRRLHEGSSNGMDPMQRHQPGTGSGTPSDFNGPSASHGAKIVQTRELDNDDDFEPRMRRQVDALVDDSYGYDDQRILGVGNSARSSTRTSNRSAR